MMACLVHQGRYNFIDQVSFTFIVPRGDRNNTRKQKKQRI
jgi:hypothetical protein